MVNDLVTKSILFSIWFIMVLITSNYIQKYLKCGREKMHLKEKNTN